MTRASVANISLEVRRVIAASRAKVFEAWTRPELLQQWFGPAEIRAGAVTMDLRVGGAYRIEMHRVAAEGVPPPAASGAAKPPAAEGRYVEIVPNQRLSFTWRGDWGEMGDTLVTIEFREVEGGTEVALTHRRFANQEMADRHSHGWSGSLEKLARWIA